MNCNVGSFTFAVLQQFAVVQSNAGLVLLVIWPGPVTTWDCSHARTHNRDKERESRFHADTNSVWCIGPIQ